MSDSAKIALQRLILVVSALGFSLLVLGGIVRFYAFNLSFYQKEFSRVGTYEKLGTAANEDAQHIIAYIRGDADALPIAALTEPEREHMADVRGVFKLVRTAMSVLTVAVVVLIFLLLLLEPDAAWRHVERIFLSSGIITLALIALVGLVVLLGFDWAFTVFHSLFFAEGTWDFSADSRLMQLFPLQFFYDSVLRIVIDAILAGVVFCGAGLLLRKISLKRA